jgi:hypothetical protein
MAIATYRNLLPVDLGHNGGEAPRFILSDVAEVVHFHSVWKSANGARLVEFASGPLSHPHPHEVIDLGVDEKGCAVLGPVPAKRKSSDPSRVAVLIPSRGLVC